MSVVIDDVGDADRSKTGMSHQSSVSLAGIVFVILTPLKERVVSCRITHCDAFAI